MSTWEVKEEENDFISVDNTKQGEELTIVSGKEIKVNFKGESKSKILLKFSNGKSATISKKRMFMLLKMLNRKDLLNVTLIATPTTYASPEGTKWYINLLLPQETLNGVGVSV